MYNNIMNEKYNRDFTLNSTKTYDLNNDYK